jgi:pimeloyl-ACP methyl ester carboxylesterase
MLPRTRYTKSGNVSIAYQVLGEGPIDLVYTHGWISNVEYAWENPDCARFLRHLASFSRLFRFDKRGTGLSDRDVALSTLEQRVDDIRAVMDAVGSERGSTVRQFRRCLHVGDVCRRAS